VAKRSNQSLLAQLHIPLLMVGAFALGAGGMWLIMRTPSSETVIKPPVENSNPSNGAEPPDVSRLAPADAARTLANWNYDRQNWAHAIDHYQEAIARGADNPDVRTDLGNCFRFIGQPQKALEQYHLAQAENPQHENSLFNQAGLFAEVLHDDQRAVSIAREFLARFPQSPRAESARELIAHLQQRSNNGH